MHIYIYICWSKALSQIVLYISLAIPHIICPVVWKGRRVLRQSSGIKRIDFSKHLYYENKLMCVFNISLDKYTYIYRYKSWDVYASI